MCSVVLNLKSSMKYVKERIEDPLNPNAVTALVTSVYNNADTELERYCSELADCSIDYGVRFWHDRLKTCCVAAALSFLSIPGWDSQHRKPMCKYHFHCLWNRETESLSHWRGMCS